MNWKKQKVVVTGAGGFIGSHLVEKLVELGAKVRAFVRYNSRNDWGMIEMLSPKIKEKIEISAGDIRDQSLCQKFTKDCEVVFHLAALIAIPYSYQTPESYFQTNVLGTLNLMQSCLKNKVKKIVHTSTSEVYGTAQYIPIDEKHPLQAQSPYSASKIAADKIAESFYKTYNLPVAVIRPFNTYGPRQSDRAIIPTIIIQALKKKIIKIGSTTPRRDFNYISDTVNGFIKIAESEKSTGQVINIGAGKDISIGELVEMILSIMNKNIKIISSDERKRPQKSEVMQLLCDNNKAKKLVGWEPEISLRKGLIKTIQWIKNHPECYNPDRYRI